MLLFQFIKNDIRIHRLVSYNLIVQINMMTRNFGSFVEK